MIGCPFCDDIKSKLKENNLPFTEIDVESPKNAFEVNKLMEITKSDSVPIVIVGKKILVPSVSFKTINEGIDLVKSLL